MGFSPASGRAQEPLPSQLQENVYVHLVQLDILATDSHGRPVTDLSAKDLIVREEGREQTIALFLPHATRRERPGPLPEARILFDAPDGSVPRSLGGVEPRWFFFLFDLVHGDPRDRESQRDAAKEFLAGRISPSDRVAVASFDGRFRLEANFSNDTPSQQAAIDLALSRPAAPSLWQARVRELLTLLRNCQSEMVASRGFGHGRECFAAQMRAYARETADDTKRFIDILDTASRLLAGVQGRKYLFFFSHGVSIDPSLEAIEAARSIAGNNEQIQDLRFELSQEVDYRRALYEAIERAIRSNVTVFTLDASPPPSNEFGAQNATAIRRGAQPYLAAFNDSRDGLEEIARGTGGRFFGSARFASNLGQAMDATAGAYTVGYYSDLRTIRKAEDAIKVSVKSSRRGVRITSRTWRMIPPVAMSRNLGRIDVGDPRREAGKTVVPFSVALDPAAFEPTPGGGSLTISPTLHLILRTRQGIPIAESFHFVSHEYATAEWERGKTVPLRYSGSIELDPGEYVLSVLIRDPRRDSSQEISHDLTAGAPGAR